VRKWEIVSLPALNPARGDSGFTPGQFDIAWQDGRSWRVSAPLTAIFPDVTYVEAARHLGLRPDPLFSCPSLETAPTMISLPRNPIGAHRDCPSGGGTGCFLALGDAEDPLREGAIYTASDGRRYTKRRGGFAMFSYHYWQLESTGKRSRK
jgi:hypothetical protein